MIISVIKLPVLILLVAVLGFNLMQRKHLSYGEQKRFASLRIAGLVLLLYVAILVIEQLVLSEWLLVAVLFVIGVFLRVYKGQIFVFKAKCPKCGRRYSLAQILYHDGPTCVTCRPEMEPVPESIPVSQRSVNDVKDVDWPSYEFTDHAVLCYIRVDGQVLLIEKKTGLGAGKVNAPGGRIEDGETAEQAAVREVQEEIVVTPRNLHLGAEVSFIFTNGYSLTAQVFTSDAIDGDPTETVEAKPFWVAEADIPYDRMWEDDKAWLPLMLSGNVIKGQFIFDGEHMISSDIKVNA